MRGIPASSHSLIILSVISTSALLGVTSWLGWLCIIIIDAAFDSTADFNISLGCAIDWSSAPIDTKFTFTGRILLSKFITPTTSLSYHDISSASALTTASGDVRGSSDVTGSLPFTSLTDTVSSLNASSSDK